VPGLWNCRSHFFRMIPARSMFTLHDYRLTPAYLASL
jgi:hypothetical protein